jgi:hypothetical protein
MSMAYVRKYYGVPAKRGGRIEYTGGRTARQGVITSATNGRINVRFDGDTFTSHMHPTWEIRYLEAKGGVA